MSRDGAITFGDLVGKLDHLELTCTTCGRHGRYAVQRLIEMDLIKHLANALIEVHGPGAVSYAERAAVKVRTIGLPEKAEIWGRVIATLRARQAT